MDRFFAKTLIATISLAGSTSAKNKAWCDGKDHEEKEGMYFDYIVTGAGPGGGVVASRLVEAGFKTLLLDAGPDYDTYVTQTPLAWPLSTIDPRIEWAVRTKNSNVEGRDNILYPRAAMIGGCGLHNAMQACYSYPDTWDNLKNLTGDTEFGEEEMRTRFMAIEKNEYVSDSTPGHGFDGFMATSLADTRLLTDAPFQDDKLDYVFRSIAGKYPSEDPEFAVSPELPIIADINSLGANSVQGTHILPNSITAKGRKRSGVYDLIKDTQAAYPDKFIIKPYSHVKKVLLTKDGKGDKPVAYGVEVQEGKNLHEASTGTKEKGKQKTYYARKELIVSGGTFQTPQILMLSGIGPKQQLESFDIPVMADVPGVGSNLRDKLEATMNFRMTSIWGIYKAGCSFFMPTPEEDQCYVDYAEGDFTDAPNLYTSAGPFFSTQVKSSPDLASPDLYMTVAPLYFQGYRDGWVDQAFSRPDFLTLNTLTEPLNSGAVKLKSADPFDSVMSDFNGYDDADLTRVAGFIQDLRELGLDWIDANVAAEEIQPGPNVTTLDDIKDWILEYGWGHHACCTAKIGADDDEMAVLDGQFKVRAVDYLRVVDLSAFPVDSGFFPMVPLYMLAGKAAEDIIKADLTISSKDMGCKTKAKKTKKTKKTKKSKAKKTKKSKLII